MSDPPPAALESAPSLEIAFETTSVPICLEPLALYPNTINSSST